LFGLVEEALDEIALLVEVDVIGALNLAVALGRDDDLRAGFGDRGVRDEILREDDVAAFVRSSTPPS
jgi:hypothetical protein